MLNMETLCMETSPVSVPSQLPYVWIYIFFNWALKVAMNEYGACFHTKCFHI